MERSKISLEKIEVKKIKQNSERKLNMSVKGSRNYLKPELKDNLSKDEILIDISEETIQNVVKLFPKHMAMAGDGSHRDEDVKRYEKYGTCLDAEKKFNYNDVTFNQNRPQSPSCDSNVSSSMLSSKSSVVSMESQISVQERISNYDELMDKNNARLQRRGVESKKKEPSNNYVVSTTIVEPIRGKHIRGSQLLNERNYFSKKTHFNDNDVKRDSDKNSDHLPLCEEKVQLKELREALEKSTNCLLKCLVNLQCSAQKQDILNLEGDQCSKKSSFRASKCQYNEKESQILNTKVENNNSDISLPSSCILIDNSPTGVKQRISMETDVTDIDNSEIMPMKCPCDCCNGKCLHKFGDVTKMVAIAKVAKQKTTSSVSKRYLSGNLCIPKATLNLSRLRPKNKKQNITSPQLKNLVKIGTFSDKNETERNENGSRRILKLHSNDNKLFEGYSSSYEKSNRIRKAKNAENCLRRKSETHIINDNDKLRNHPDQNISNDNEVDYDRNNIVFPIFLLAIPILFFSIMFIISSYLSSFH